MNIRIQSTGEVVSEQGFRALHPNTSLPQQLTETLINDMGGDVVYEGPQATGGEFWQYSVYGGVEQKNGKWYTKWNLGPAFFDTEDADGKVTTAAENQAAYIAMKTQERALAVKNQIIDATQKRLDDFAQTRNYDGILSACTYATSAVPKFATEGQYCVEVRDTTWAALYDILEEVQAGTRPQPSEFADIESDLPALTWP
jgi:hypothetical protein